jgi:hypothetical protein
MISNEKMFLIMKYEDEFLELIDHQDDYTRSDLQGRCTVIVMNILNEKKIG